MSKIILAVLTAAAFLYALWLVLFRRQLPDSKQATGLKRRFILATLLFVGFFGTISVRGDQPKVNVEKLEVPLRNPVSCYSVIFVPDIPRNHNQFVMTVRAVWRTLDPNRSEEFRKKLEKAVEGKAIGKKTADMLAIAFSEVAYHKQRTRGDGPQKTCYKMTPLGGTLTTTRENILKQIGLLEKARKSGKIDEETSRKTLQVLEREVEMLYRAKSLEWPKDRIEQDKLIKEYKDGKLIAGDSASIAARLIFKMHDVKVLEMTPAKRLDEMKERVETLLIGSKKDYGSGGPTGNDWMDPGIHPNVYAILAKEGLLPVGPMVDCYKRMAGPVKQRSEELKKLQQQLLDKNVKTGVLDVEIAEKAALSVDDKNVDFATEADIRKYQKKVRRTIRMLYKHGELPSSFVEKVENATDIEIIEFDPSKALRNDVQWHLRSLFWRPLGDDIVRELEQRKIIPKARNHRMMMNWTWYNKNKKQLEENKKQLAVFITLLDSQEPPKFGDDKGKVIKKYQLPQTDLEYRLEIRRVCRVLIKSGLIHQGRFKSLEEVIGIPIIGTIEKR